MKERPILFTGSNVCAILEGRKTQTRRVVKPQPVMDAAYLGGAYIERRPGRTDGGKDRTSVDAPGCFLARVCPYGRLGDRLWVRETWTWTGGSSTYPRDTPLPTGAYDKLYVCYAADGFNRTIETGGKVLPVPRQPPQREGEVYCLRDAPADFVYTGDNTYVDRLGRWWKRKIPAIHMPRWASRILLEITDVRVQRVQDISEEDAIAEGIRELPLQEREPGAGWCADPLGNPTLHYRTPRAAFAALWDSINEGRGFGWNANPWVWAVTFLPISVASNNG